MSATPPTNPELLQKTQAKLDNWDLLSQGEDVILEWARTEIPRRLVDVFNSQDRPLQIIVHERLFDAVTEALQSIHLPDNMKYPEDANAVGEIEENVRQFCREIAVRSASTQDMVLPPEYDVLTPDRQFVFIVTMAQEQQKFLMRFDSSLGISKYLRENSFPIQLTESDVLEMAKLYVLLQCMGQAQAQAQQQVVAASSRDLGQSLYSPR